jgi:hypothetical protein
MNAPYQNEERRFALRMALRLPVVVSGRAEDGSAWSEPTETDDISTMGALFHLNQKVSRGERLYLRAHRPDGAPIEVTAMVVRVAPAIYGTARVGVQIAESAENWLRLFVSWVADEQPPTDAAADSETSPPE